MVIGFVKIFIFDVPIIRAAPELAFDDGCFKLWTVVAQPFNKWRVTSMRETVLDSKGRSISLQQRINDYLTFDSTLIGLCALAAPFYVRPANQTEVSAWLGGHYKRVLE